MSLWQRAFDFVRAHDSDDGFSVVKTTIMGHTTVKIGFTDRGQAEDFARKFGGKVIPTTQAMQGNDEGDEDDDD